MLLLLIPVIIFLVLLAIKLKNYRVEKISASIPFSRLNIPFVGVVFSLLGDSEYVFSQINLVTREAVAAGGHLKLYLQPTKICCVITDPEDVTMLLKYHLDKPHTFYSFMEEFVGKGIFTLPVDEWRIHRRLMMPALSPTVVDTYMNIFQRNCSSLVKKLDTVAGTGDIQLEKYINTFQCNVVCETIFGFNLNVLENPDHPIIANINLATELCTKRMAKLWQHPDWVYRFQKDRKTYLNACRYMRDLLEELILKRKSMIQNRKNTNSETIEKPGLDTYRSKPLVDILLEGTNMSVSEMIDDLIVSIIAGTDTSAASISTTLLLLGKYPKIQQKVYEELRNRLGDSDRAIDKADLKEMPYIERVLKEVLRLYDPGSIFARKMTKDVKLPSGHTLPSDTIVLFNMFEIHRDKNHWGPDAESFDPDRFLPERLNLKHPGSYMPFSTGPRNCPGAYYAQMISRLAILNVIRKFKVIAEPEETSVPQMRLRFDIIVTSVVGYRVRLERR